jgi:hypothetical protein
MKSSEVFCTHHNRKPPRLLTSSLCFGVPAPSVCTDRGIHRLKWFLLLSLEPSLFCFASDTLRSLAWCVVNGNPFRLLSNLPVRFLSLFIPLKKENTSEPSCITSQSSQSACNSTVLDLLELSLHWKPNWFSQQLLVSSASASPFWSRWLPGYSSIPMQTWMQHVVHIPYTSAQAVSVSESW